MCFKSLIQCTKQVEDAQAKYQNLLAGNASEDELQSASNTLQENLNSLAKAASIAFAGAKSGDGIHVISGRNNGDDDDSVGVFFSGSDDSDCSTKRFVERYLKSKYVENWGDEEDNEPPYFIVTDVTLDDYLMTNQD